MTRTITCIVPARNEAGHLRDVIDHVLSLLEISDIIIIEGGSTDNTWEVALDIEANNPKRVRALQQKKTGKFNAVSEAAALANSEMVLIWDADGTVPICCSQRLIASAIRSGNPTMGDRLRGDIQKGAMQKANWLGNWAFAILWAPILLRRPSDMLCGTKIVPTEIIQGIPSWLLKADPYGDFALIATSRMNGLSVDSIIVDYKARTYSSTNIKRWQGGFKLLLTTFRIYARIFKKIS